MPWETNYDSLTKCGRFSVWKGVRQTHYDCCSVIDGRNRNGDFVVGKFNITRVENGHLRNITDFLKIFHSYWMWCRLSTSNEKSPASGRSYSTKPSHRTVRAVPLFRHVTKDRSVPRKRALKGAMILESNIVGSATSIKPKRGTMVMLLTRCPKKGNPNDKATR